MGRTSMLSLAMLTSCYKTMGRRRKKSKIVFSGKMKIFRESLGRSNIITDKGENKALKNFVR